MNPIWAVIAVRGLLAAVLAPALARALKLPRFALSVPAAFLVSLSCVFTFVGGWTWGLPIVSRVKTGRRQVFLTFDDGPSSEITPRVLDVLAEFDASATFFVLGDSVRRHPELLRRIAAEGHAIGLHGDRHHSLVLASPTQILSEISRARAAVCDVCPEISPRFFRPPHGFKTLAMPFLVRRIGLCQIAWSVNPRDYRADVLPLEIADAVCNRLAPGAIILLHDGPGRTTTADALPLILRRLREYGYESTSLEQNA